MIPIAGNALAYCEVSMFRAAFEEGLARPGKVHSNRPGSVVMASEPMPLLTLTMTGALLACNSGRKARVTRTTPTTSVS